MAQDAEEEEGVAVEGSKLLPLPRRNLQVPLSTVGGGGMSRGLMYTHSYVKYDT